MPAIATIAITPTCARVKLTSTRIIYQGRWEAVSEWFDVKGRDRAYLAEFVTLAKLMHFRQLGQNGAQIFDNV